MAKGFKTGGREKGSLNKTTAETKDVLQKIINRELQDLEKTLSEMNASDRINIVIKLLPYVIPRQSEMAFDVPAESQVIISLGSGIKPDET